MKNMSLDSVKRLLSETNSRTVNSHIFTAQGYCVCIQVGFGAEQISAGIALMKGTNDKSQAWPFNMIVIFRLKNLSGGKHFVRMFRCDRNTSRCREALLRPRSHMNPAIGFPCFISRTRLLNEGFVKNNEMLLQCYIFPKDTKINQEPDYPTVIKSATHS